jgi:hypothetical protein
MEMLSKEVLQSLAIRTKAEKTPKGISERKGKEVPRASSAKDVEWQGQFEVLAEQVAKLPKARCLDAESILKVMTRIASRASTTLPLREKFVEATSQAPLTSPPTAGYHVRDPSPSLSPENREEETRQSRPPRSRRHYTPDYSKDNRRELEVWKTRRYTRPSDSPIVLVKKENTQTMDKPEVCSRMSTDDIRVWHKSVKIYLQD